MTQHRILCRHEQCASHYIYSGLKNGFEKIGHRFHFYDPKHTSTFKAFSTIEPTIFWGQGYNLTKDEIKCCNARPNTKVVLKVGFNGKFNEDCDRIKYPTGPFITPEEEKNVLSIKNLNLVWGYGPPKMAEYIIGNWKKYTKIHAILPAADPQIYYPVTYNKDYESDIFFTGSYWDYKKNLQWLVKLCYPVGKYNIKITGNGAWPVSQYIGQITEQEQRIYHSSGKIFVNTSEPHATDFCGFEVNERTFKLGSSRCFVISDYVQGLVDLFPDSVVFCKTFNEFKEKVDYYLTKPEERQEYAQRLYREVMTNHTYDNRVQELLEILT